MKVRKRLLARHRVVDNSSVLLDVPDGERAHLIEMMPEAFFIELYYQGHDIVLARLDHVPADIVERILGRRWRQSAAKRAIAEFNARRA